MEYGVNTFAANLTGLQLTDAVGTVFLHFLPSCKRSCTLKHHHPASQFYTKPYATHSRIVIVHKPPEAVISKVALELPLSIHLGYIQSIIRGMKINPTINYPTQIIINQIMHRLKRWHRAEVEVLRHRHAARERLPCRIWRRCFCHI